MSPNSIITQVDATIETFHTLAKPKTLLVFFLFLGMLLKNYFTGNSLQYSNEFAMFYVQMSSFRWSFQFTFDIKWFNFLIYQLTFKHNNIIILQIM